MFIDIIWLEINDGDSVGVGWLKGVKKDDEDEDGSASYIHCLTNLENYQIQEY